MPKDNKSVDSIDLKILRELDRSGRISYSELAAKIGMSSPSVTERIKRMENAGVIRSFTVEIDLGMLGYALEAIVRVKPRPGNLHIIKKMIIEETRFTTCDAVTGDDCFVCRLVFGAMEELDSILEPFHEKAETNTAIIKSSPVRHRLPKGHF
jgi:Lrp/AsnC family leucine-responsive transcriptional regulator